MTRLAHDIAASAWTPLGGDPRALEALEFTTDGALASTFAVSDLASAAVGVAALAVAELAGAHAGRLPNVQVDRRLASFWFGLSLRPLDFRLQPPWDPIAGDYRARDGWIRLHTNAPHHRAAAQRVLGAHGDRAAMAGAVAQWDTGALEAAIVAEHGCAAEMRSIAEWSGHAQGIAVAREPLVHQEPTSEGPAALPTGSPAQPLAGIRVLDLTRVLAGPVASRFLAGYGADVLRIDPPDWNEAAIVPETTLGKRCARLDLKTTAGLAAFESLLRDADVLLHGYRADALERLGFDASARQRLRPGLVDVCLDAYGWTGPWRNRRGFDSLVQMSSGIAEAGMRWRNAEQPVPLPVQALDHATGYLIAATAARALTRRRESGRGTQARLSLARTAKLLVDCGAGHDAPPFEKESERDRAPEVEVTSWGRAQRLTPPVTIDGAPMRWERPARELGADPARWV